jgi:sporulation protein YlmC with PRC-barrel domain
MRTPRLARLLGTATLLASVSAFAAAAQAPPPAPTPADPPVATAPKPAPNELIGLTVHSSDGNRLGTVQTVDAEPGGKVKAIHIKTGGFLGFGGKIVAVPDDKFDRKGASIQLRLTAEEVSKLPEVKEQS